METDSQDLQTVSLTANGQGRAQNSSREVSHPRTVDCAFKFVFNGARLVRRNGLHPSEESETGLIRGRVSSRGVIRWRSTVRGGWGG